MNSEQIDRIVDAVSVFIEGRQGREFSEHDLIKAIEIDMPLPGCEETVLDLFVRHFLVRHALYRLQEVYLEQRKAILHITAVSIRCVPWDASQNAELSMVMSADGSERLRDYYLDLDNVVKEDADSVQALLDDFWRRYSKFTGIANKHVTDALEVLGLEPSAEWVTVRKRYRMLMQTHHPDAGGDTDTCIRIQQAYERVKASMTCKGV